MPKKIFDYWNLSEEECKNIYNKGHVYARNSFIKDNRHLVNLTNSSFKKYTYNILIDERKEEFWRGCYDFFKSEMIRRKIWFE